MTSSPGTGSSLLEELRLGINNFFLCFFLDVFNEEDHCLLWFVSRSLVKIDQHFRSACCLHLQVDESSWWWASTANTSCYTAQHPRRQSSSHSSLWESEILPIQRWAA
jgi:hypothetical protein